MQTFLPYADFSASARVLDNKRLGKQRVENLQIMKALTVPDAGWKNHPAVRMWSGYEDALYEYHKVICTEWLGRGFKDTCLIKIADLHTDPFGVCEMPWWLCESQFHASHRSNLLRKYPEWYSIFGWDEADDLPYWWPTHHALSSS